jgi:hypothetical protein
MKCLSGVKIMAMSLASHNYSRSLRTGTLSHEKIMAEWHQTGANVAVRSTTQSWLQAAA